MARQPATERPGDGEAVVPQLVLCSNGFLAYPALPSPRQRRIVAGIAVPRIPVRQAVLRRMAFGRALPATS